MAVFDIPEAVFTAGGEIDLVLENTSGKKLTAVAYLTPLVNPEPVSTFDPQLCCNGLTIGPIFYCLNSQVENHSQYDRMGER